MKYNADTTLGLIKTFLTICFIGVGLGNLGIAPLWLPELLGLSSGHHWLPEILVFSSIFLFFATISFLFYIMYQSVLVSEA